MSAIWSLECRFGKFTHRFPPLLSSSLRNIWIRKVLLIRPFDGRYCNHDIDQSTSVQKMAVAAPLNFHRGVNVRGAENLRWAHAIKLLPIVRLSRCKRFNGAWEPRTWLLAGSPEGCGRFGGHLIDFLCRADGKWDHPITLLPCLAFYISFRFFSS